MKTLSKYIIKSSILFILFGLYSCVIESFDDPGKPITFNTQTNEFNSVAIKSIFDIVLVQDSGNYITFKCGANQKNKISLVNQNGLLSLQQNTEPSVRGNYKHIKAYVHFKNIITINLDNCVTLENSGNISQTSLELIDRSELSEVKLTVDLENLIIRNNNDNLSYYTILGKSTNVAFYLYGSSIMKAAGLESDFSTIEQGSIGDCSVYVSKKLNVRFLERGNVFLKGNAEIVIDPNELQQKVQVISGN